MQDAWITPKQIDNLGVFKGINSTEGFNSIIGNPANWSKILNNSVLLEKWIVPNAVILFGKSWFDRVKWKKYIHSGIPFSLFTFDERQHILSKGRNFENTPFGKSVIAKITMKVSCALYAYLEGKWYNGKIVKNPAGYIIDSIKNEMIREVGNDLGFKVSTIAACPYCLTKEGKKVILTYHGSRSYSCSRCEEVYNSVSDVKELSKIKIFKRFFGVTCVCPSDNCKGHFVPLNAIDICSDLLNRFDKSKFKKNMESIRGGGRSNFIPRNIYSFVEPPEDMKDIPLLCPYCDTKFTPRSALQKTSGFKNKSGHFTGLPTISIWKKKDEAILDKAVASGKELTKKDNLVTKYIEVDDYIVSNQKINIVISEMIIRMSKANKKLVSGLLSWYFFMAAIKWSQKYQKDALEYFFNYSSGSRKATDKEIEMYGRDTKDTTNVIRGKEASIHYSFVNTWINLLDENINEFSEIDPNIKSLGDLKMFCHPPKFSGGPLSSFDSIIDSKGYIKNNTDLICVKSQKFRPRMAKVISIEKDGEDYMNKIAHIEWHNVCLKDVVEGDKVRVTAIMMSGHPTHAPFLRLMRLRRNILKPFIERIVEEEKSGERDIEFWEEWEQNVKIANKLIKR